MTEIPVSPGMTSVPIPFTDDQLRAIYARIELIDKHFEACCAFGLDECRYNGEYNDLYGRLHMAGLPSVTTPIERPGFESWLQTRSAS